MNVYRQVLLDYSVWRSKDTSILCLVKMCILFVLIRCEGSRIFEYFNGNIPYFISIFYNNVQFEESR